MYFVPLLPLQLIVLYVLREFFSRVRCSNILISLRVTSWLDSHFVALVQPFNTFSVIKAFSTKFIKTYFQLLIYENTKEALLTKIVLESTIFCLDTLTASWILYSRFRKIWRINSCTEKRLKLVICNLLPKVRIKKRKNNILNLASNVILTR